MTRSWPNLVLFSLAVAVATMAPRQVKAQSHSLVRIPAGTQVPMTDNPAASSGRWNRLVFLAIPEISSGDVDQLSENNRLAAASFTLTALATVNLVPQSSGVAQYHLLEVGVGYSVPIDGVLTVVTPDTAAQLGVRLGFVQSRILSQNDKDLADVQSIVRTSTLGIFDAPAIMLRGGKHRKYITRHLLWIDAKSGSGATILWLLERDAGGNMIPADEPLRLVAIGTKEHRKIHVDGNEFLLGFPGEQAFALEDLPPGKKIAWTRDLSAIAALPQYTSDQLAQLSAALNQAIGAVGSE